MMHEMGVILGGTLVASGLSLFLLGVVLARCQPSVSGKRHAAFVLVVSLLLLFSTPIILVALVLAALVSVRQPPSDNDASYLLGASNDPVGDAVTVPEDSINTTLPPPPLLSPPPPPSSSETYEHYSSPLPDEASPEELPMTLANPLIRSPPHKAARLQSWLRRCRVNCAGFFALARESWNALRDHTRMASAHEPVAVVVTACKKATLFAKLKISLTFSLIIAQVGTVYHVDYPELCKAARTRILNAHPCAAQLVALHNPTQTARSPRVTLRQCEGIFLAGFSTARVAWTSNLKRSFCRLP
jgi:hypothetical protein